MKLQIHQLKHNGTSQNGHRQIQLRNDGKARSNGKRKPVLITGGAGFIGTNLAVRLLREGRRIRIFDNLSRPGVERNLEWLQERYADSLEVCVEDMRDADAVHNAVQGVEAVFHLAAQVAVTTSLVDPVEDFAINAGGAVNLLEALRSLPVCPPLVFTSTNKVYGHLEDVDLCEGTTRYVPRNAVLALRGVSEDRSLSFASPYGCSKGTADQYILDYARSFGLPAAVFRMSCIYGPHQCGNEDQGWVAHFLLRAIDGAPITIFGNGKQVRDVLYVNDLLEAFLLAEKHMQHLKGQAFNIGGGPGNTISLLELLDCMRELRLSPRVGFEQWRVADQRYYVSDTRRFTAATGWRPTHTARVGLGRLHAWLRDHVLETPADSAEGVRHAVGRA